MPEFVKPEISELSFVKKMLGNEHTMDWLGHTISFEKEHWSCFYRKYVDTDPKENFFRLIWCPGCNDFVGAAAYFHNRETGRHDLKLLIDSSRRFCGYGRWALNALKSAARENGISALACRVRKDNTAWDFLEEYGFSREKEDDSFCFEICQL